ncbi:MAG: DUF2807 domain-containing protein [Caldisericia bacterium]|nr:DUF2807 domain-containing protein [Caldisericia bacterium]
MNPPNNPPEMTVQDYIFAPFHSIQFSCIGTVKIQKGDSYRCTVQADDGLLEKLRIVENQQILYLEFRHSLHFLSWLGRNIARSIIFTIEVPTLRSMTLSGFGHVESTDFSADEFALHVKGSGNVRMDMNVKQLVVDITGAGRIALQGNAESQSVSITGAGNYDARNLLSKNASIQIHGAGKTVVHVEDNLKVSIGGAGSVRYLGQPHVLPSIYGAGSVLPIKESPEDTHKEYDPTDVS